MNIYVFTINLIYICVMESVVVTNVKCMNVAQASTCVYTRM